MPIQGFQSHCEPEQSIIVSRDDGNSRVHRAYNKQQQSVTHYKIDGVVVTEGNKCDYILMNESKKVAYLIELKGRDLSHAVKQLEGTETTLGVQLAPYKLLYRIVASKCRTSAIRGTAFRKFQEKKKSAFKYSTNLMEEEI